MSSSGILCGSPTLDQGDLGGVCCDTSTLCCAVLGGVGWGGVGGAGSGIVCLQMLRRFSLTGLRFICLNPKSVGDNVV